MPPIDQDVVPTTPTECRKCGTTVSYIHVDQVDQDRSIATYCETCRRSVHRTLEDWLPFRCTLCDGALLPSGFTYLSRHRYSQETVCSRCSVNVRWSRRKTAPDWTFAFKSTDRKKTARNVEFMRMQFVLHHQEPSNVAVMLLDRQANALMLRFTSEWDRYTRDELQSISAMAEYVHLNAIELGAADFVGRLEKRLSKTLRISEPELVVAGNPHALLDSLSGVVLSPAGVPIESKAIQPVKSVKVTLVDSIARFLKGPVLQPRLALAAGVLALIVGNIAVLNRTQVREADPAPVPASQQVTSAFIGPEEPVVSEAPIRQVVRRRVKRHIAPKPAPVLVVRTFQAPEPRFEIPEVTLLAFAGDLSPVAEDLQMPEGVFMLPTLAPPRESLTRRILQAMATPFRKMGTLFASN